MLDLKDFYRKGISHYNVGNYREAIECFKTVLKESELKPFLFVDLGDAYRCYGKVKKGIKNYKKALNLDPAYAKAWFGLGLSYLDLEEYENAVESLQKGLQVNPSNANMWSNLGVAYLYANQNKDALIAFHKSVNIQPSYTAWARMGELYFYKDDFENAIECFEAAIMMEPIKVSDLKLLAKSYTATNMFEKALKAYEKLITFNSQATEFWFLKASIHERLEEHEKAKYCLERILELEPDSYSFDGEFLTRLTYSYFECGEVQRGIYYADRALDIHPENSEFLFFVAEELSENERYEDSIHYFRKALQLDSTNIKGWHNYGHVLYETGSFQEAITCFERVLQQEPDNLDTKLFLGYCHQCLENYVVAIDCYKRGLELDSQQSYTPEVFHFMGQCYYELGYFQESLKCFKKALKSFPNNGKTLYYLGLLYEQTGNFLYAFDYYEKARTGDPSESKAIDKLEELKVSEPEVWKDFLIHQKNETEKPKYGREDVFDISQLEVSRGGDWKVKGNQSIFTFKIKIHNLSSYILTDIHVFLANIPNGLKVIQDRYHIPKLNPNSFESPSFELRATKSCIGDVIKGIVTFSDHHGEFNTIKVEPFTIKYVCNLLVPKEITTEEFNKQTAQMEEKSMIFTCDKDTTATRELLNKILQKNNFYLLQQLQQSRANQYNELKAFAQGLYDKQDVALNILLEHQQEGTKVILKGLSEKHEKTTDILRDISSQCDDIKSDTELLEEYSDQFKELFDKLGKLETIEQYLRDHLGSDWQKIKNAWEDYKNRKISWKKLLFKGIKVVGKKFIKMILK